MKSVKEITREVQERNLFRTEVGLPEVSVFPEVKKIYQAELRKQFLDWAETYPLQDQIRAEVLDECRRRRRSDPGWQPFGLLNGGLEVELLVERRMREIWKTV